MLGWLDISKFSYCGYGRCRVLWFCHCDALGPQSAVAWAGTGGAQARVLARNASHGSRHSLAF